MGLAKCPRKVQVNWRVLDKSHWSCSKKTGVLSLKGLNDRYPKGAWVEPTKIVWE